MKKKLLFFLASLFVAALIGLVKENQVRASAPSATADMLRESYAIINTQIDGKSAVNEPDRLWYLGNLVNVAAKIDSRLVPDGQLEKWGDELLRLSRTKNHDIDDWSKLASAKNAATYISKVNPAKGLQILSDLSTSPPPLDQNGQFPEDVRAFAATSVFENAWNSQGTGALPAIEKTALTIGETGEYPYQAMSTIIVMLGRSSSDRQTAQDLFDIALNAYLHPVSSRTAKNRDDEFLTFLQNTKDSVDSTIFQSAVSRFADHVAALTPEREPKKSIFRNTLFTRDGSVIELDNDRDAILFHAFPLIREINSEKASELQTEIPALQQGDLKIDFEAAAYGKDAPTPDTLQDALLLRIRLNRDIHNDAALRMTSKLTGTRHTIALAWLLPMIAKFDSNMVKQLYADEVKKFESFDVSAPRMLDAKVAMAEAAFFAEDFDRFQYYASQVCVEATQMLNHAATVKTTGGKQFYVNIDNRPGYRPLKELLRFASANNVSWIKNDTLRLLDSDIPALKAYLLLYAAQGESELEARTFK